MTATGRVILPPGFMGALTDLKVHTGIDQQPVAADGTFHVQVLGPGPGWATLIDPSGKVVLLGYLDAASSGSPFAGGKGEISAPKSALALAFFAIGGLTIPPSGWSRLRDLIDQSPALAPLGDVIAARVAADPIALTDGDAEVRVAVQQARMALLQKTQLGHHPPQPLDSNTTLLLVQPSGEQSGIEVLNTDSGISFSNHLRRRAAAAIYETAVQLPGGDLHSIPAKPLMVPQSTTLKALGTVLGLNPVGSESPIMEVAPANALHGIVGSITDALEDNSAFTAAPTPPTGGLVLPQDGDAVKTVYTLILLGPAFQKLNSLAGFPPFADAGFATSIQLWEDTLETLNLEEWLLDIIIPVLGALPLPEAAQIKGISGATLQELANLLTNIPDLNASVAKGDFKGASGSAIQTLVDNGALREEIVKTIYSQFTPEVTLLGQVATASEALKGVFSSVAIFEAVLQGIDTSAVLVASSSNNPGEEWTATLVQKVAHLTPQTANLDQNHFTVELTADPGTPADPNKSFVYLWSVTGSAGGALADPDDTTGTKNKYQSFSNQATYYMGSTAADGQTDTVTVQVFLNGGTPSAPSRGMLLGQASSVLTVKLLPCDQALPQSVVSICGDAIASPTTVKPGGQLTVDVTLNLGGACGNGASLSLNGTPFSNATLDGLPVSGGQVFIPGMTPATGKVTHQVVFTISGNAPLQCPTGYIAGPNDVIPFTIGPWVVLNAGSGGNNSGWSSVHPFIIAP